MTASMSAPTKMVTVLFDEHHSESWTIDRRRAQELNPAFPENSSYAKAARLLTRREFLVHRNRSERLSPDLLKTTDILVIPHPCDGTWEKTTSSNSPKFSAEEIEAIEQFVERGGALLVITEYENTKYGSNLNELLQPFGLFIENTTVRDREHCVNENPNWVLADIERGDGATNLLHMVNRACFYTAGSCRIEYPAVRAVCSSSASTPSGAVLVGVAEPGQGRVVVVTDSDLFGDEFIESMDHKQLWLNIFYWLALKYSGEPTGKPSSTSQVVIKESQAAWVSLREGINTLRLLQEPDGSMKVDPDVARNVNDMIPDILQNLSVLSATFPHQTEYFSRLAADLIRWRSEGFGKPDFTASLAAFAPQEKRVDGLQQLAVFPMYTPNASSDVRFEALLIEVLWPAWLSSLQETRYQENSKFVPAQLIDFSEGYNSECAVLFPETVSVKGKDENRFGIIFCDREAARFQEVVSAAIDIVGLDLSPQWKTFLASSELTMETFALWDLIHDTSHSRGELPFDPFMVRQRSPYWMYALEELRVDLRSYLEAIEISRDFPFAEYVRAGVLFDRIFRFAVTGARTKNYDALAGQLLFTYLHQRNVINWENNKMHINWPSLDASIVDLNEEIRALYRRGQVVSKARYWCLAHDLVSRYMSPNLASKWVHSTRSFADESDLKALISFVNDDEFPLGSFHLVLQRKLSMQR